MNFIRWKPSAVKLLALFLLISASCSDPKGIYPTKVSFNNNWVLKSVDIKLDTIDIPHIPRIEPLIVNDQWQGKLIYSKTIRVNDFALGNTFLHFEGVMHDATIVINGAKVKRHKGGYLPFSIDITDYLVKEENEIRVEVSNTNDPTIPPGKPLEGLDFNFYGGIYRDVWLITKGDVYVTDPFIDNTKEAGWLIHFDTVTQENAKGILRLKIKNKADQDSEVRINASLILADKQYSFATQLEAAKSSENIVSIPIEIESPQLWSTTSPTLYDVSVEIIADGILTDRIDDKIGIRRIRLSSDGFFLNGNKMFLRGTNRHQEYPYVGYAISNNANFRDALKVKNAGFDFVRLSHYPHDESFLDACDELGLLVMNAIPGWQHYQEGEFVDNSFRDIREMVRRDRNHPSVIFWEVSLNESGMTEEYMLQANSILKEELPFDDTYSAGWIDHPSYDLYIPARQHSKPPYYWNKYKEGKRNTLIAEYGDWEYYAHNAGFNQVAFEDLSDEERNSRQLRVHGEKRLLQQAMNFQEAANSNRKGISTIGHANWLMFDYNRGYAEDLEASGISDIFRIPKFAYYFYKSQRPPSEDIKHPLIEDGPMVKIATYWNKNSPNDIRIFSNCEAVSLFLNDSLIATKKPNVNNLSDHLHYPPFEFNLLRFESGKLKAVGLINGQEVATDQVSTPEIPLDVRVRIDTVGGFPKEKNDLFFVYAEVIDKNGTIVQSSNDLITFQLKGQGKFIGENPVKAEAGIASILFKGVSKGLTINAVRNTSSPE